MKKQKTKLITSIGGQALMEGIMMRGPKKCTMAVRKSDGTIELEEVKPLDWAKKHKTSAYKRSREYDRLPCDR